jgi:hypothetical protein
LPPIVIEHKKTKPPGITLFGSQDPHLDPCHNAAQYSIFDPTNIKKSPSKQKKNGASILEEEIK